MSSRYLYVSCPTCDEFESVYTGDLVMDRFDIDGEYLTVTCNACKARP